MKSRWVCPHCGSLSQEAYCSGDDAIECPDCRWVHLRSFWASTSDIPDGVMTIRLNGFWKGGGFSFYIEGEREEM